MLMALLIPEDEGTTRSPSGSSCGRNERGGGGAARRRGGRANQCWKLFMDASWKRGDKVGGRTRSEMSCLNQNTIAGSTEHRTGAFIAARGGVTWRRPGAQRGRGATTSLREPGRHGLFSPPTGA